MRLSLEYPNNIGMLGRFSYSEIKDTLVDKFMEVCPSSLLVGGKIKRDMGGGFSATFTNGSKILFRNLKNPIKYESLELGWFGISQVNEMGITEGIWEKLLSRLSYPKTDYHCAFAEGNFGGNCSRDGWVKKRIDMYGNDAEVLYGNTYDNWDNLAQDYKEYIESLDPIKRKLFTEGSWDLEYDIDGVQVYPEFNLAKHCVSVLPGKLSDMTYVGVDIPGPPACVIGKVDENGVLYIIESLYCDRLMGVREFAEQIRDTLHKLGANDVVMFIDPAAVTVSQTSGFSCADIMQSYFANLAPSPYVTFSDRSEVVRRALIEDKIKVLSNSSNERLIAGFMGGYRCKISNSGVLHKEPEKDEYSHIHDALQYLIAGLEDIMFADKRVDSDIRVEVFPYEISTIY